MFTVYTEKETFEEILLLDDEYPKWSAIFLHHAIICINLEDDIYEEEVLDVNSIIFQYILSTGGRELIPISSFFKDIYEDPKNVINKPRSVFFLDISADEAKEIQRKTGVIVFGREKIDDLILSSSYVKNFLKDSVYENHGKFGWQGFLWDLPPLNAIVISDNFLFANDDGIRGTQNILSFIESLLPDSLDVEFHVCVIAKEHPQKNNAWCDKKVADIKSHLRSLKKSYPIRFELVFSETIHKRIAISNYFSVTPDKGFAVFSTSDGKTVHEDNDIRLVRIFASTEVSDGDTEYTLADSRLTQIKNICNSLTEYISNSKGHKDKKILGDCSIENSIINRLVRDG